MVNSSICNRCQMLVIITLHYLKERCGADRVRTDDLRLARAALSQLSYSPGKGVKRYILRCTTPLGACVVITTPYCGPNWS